MIGRWNGYHGSTLAATALGGMKFMHEMGGMIPDIEHIDEPYLFAHERRADPGRIRPARGAATGSEDSRAGRGQGRRVYRRAVPGRGRHDLSARELLAGNPAHLPQYDVLLCADEVIGGFGRTGEWFAHEHFGFEPDTLSIAKGLTSGYIPMGGLVLCEANGSGVGGAGRRVCPRPDLFRAPGGGRGGHRQPQGVA